MISARSLLSALPLLALVGCAAGATNPSTGVDTSGGSTTGEGGAGGATTTTPHGGAGGVTTTSHGGAGGATTGTGGSATGTGGSSAGGAAGAGGTGGAGGQLTECQVASDCPGGDDECSQRTCTSGHCGVDYTPQGTAVVMQQTGDCKKLVCDGQGGTTNVNDDGDLPDDGNPCTTDVCTNGTPSHDPVAAGTSCGAKLQCDGQGACLGCLAPKDCPGTDGECGTRTCTAGACGMSYTAKGTKVAAQVAGDCKAIVCDGAGATTTIADDGDVPVDNKQCTLDQCSNGAPSNPPAPQGGGCNQNGGKLCDGKGVCAQCLAASDCAGQDTECSARACNAGICGVTNQPKGTLLKAQTAGDCKANVCDGAGSTTVQNDDKDVPVDGNACTDDACTAGVPSNPPSAAETICAQNGGKYCDGKGACVECASNADCASNVCTKNNCIAASCKDGVQNGDETGVDCGGSCAPCPTVLVLAGGSQTAYVGELHPGGAWSTTALAGVTVDGVAVGALASGQAVGLLRFTKPNDPQDNALLYTVFTPASKGGPSFWSPFTAIGPSVTTRGAPSLDGTGNIAQVVFHGMDYKHYYAAWSGSWAPPAEAVGTGGGQSYGPSPASIASRGGDATVLFHSGASNPVNATTSRDRSAGAWQGTQQLATGANFNLGPVVCAPASGPELVAVWVRADNQIMAATRAAGVWSPAAAIANAFTLDRPALTALTGSGAMLAFRGTDGKLYASLFSNASFQAPMAIANPNVALSGTPAVAHGAGGATAELAYVGTDGKGYHARFVNNAWQGVVPVGGSSLVSIAITSMP
jgi:hypothetical protein